jgi:hypothetical protein
MTPHDPRVLAVAAALIGLVDALAAERATGLSDDLVPLADAGLERRALRRLVRQGRVRSTRIGRRVYVSRADLARLVETVPTSTSAPAFGGGGASDAARAARTAYAEPLRVVRGVPR